MSAYLIQTAAARRRALHFAFRASHAEQSTEDLLDELASLRRDIEEVISLLPRRYQFNSGNMTLHRDRLTTFLLLHILRHNLFIIIGRAELQIYARDYSKANLIPQVRRNRISHALPVAGLILEVLKSNICFDPQVGVHAYVALEILLFEPRRLAQQDPLFDSNSSELMDAIPHLLTVIRSIAGRSEFVTQLHVEAVHRLLRCGCSSILTKGDMDAFRSEYRLVGQEPAEYDFRDFRWAKLERLRRGAKSIVNIARDESLLEFKMDAETAAPSAISSPRLDALDVSLQQSISSDQPTDSSIGSDPLSIHDQPNFVMTNILQSTQSLEAFDAFNNSAQDFPLDWAWLLGESAHPGQQSGDPTAFWNQLEHI
ncbi:uncharacterized protein PV09_02376 [Verruconis gallopava]|uniref:Transcription factor domain-containing protein n=1 Tax=Verruconis gallopava TaxID=253628 RepID=A0A0D2AJC2_9PEZI|nr:uncharacterized protein PV09_02376 [Verruconis gallopava]KIW06670.1 hypothetical protein PV09_02376 [Verruconis gallopava]